MTRNHGGFDLQLQIADGLGEKWYDRNVPSKPEIDVLRSFRLRPGARVFNLGAHQGIHAIILAKVVGPDGHVVALEPNPHNVEVAERNRELNDVDQLQIVQAAAAELSGIAAFSELNAVVQETEQGRFSTISVDALSVDELSRQYGTPDVLFVDIEGFECRVLAGARQTLEARPDWFIEVHVKELGTYGNSVPELLSYFNEDDYDLFVAKAEERSPEGSQFERFISGSDAVPASARWFLIAAASRPLGALDASR